MPGLKPHQPPLDIDAQVHNLCSIGLQINDKVFAKKILNEVSYFRLIKAYGIEYKVRNMSYSPNASFENIVGLYKFDSRFRQLLFGQIETIEVCLRCRLANYISSIYGIHGYLDKNNFSSEKYHNEFVDSVNDALKTNSKSPFVKNFKKNYTPGDLPFYALVEILSFGTLSKFFKNLRNPDKKAIGNEFGVGYTYLESWFESISYVRNLCAHYKRIYNAELAITPNQYTQYKKSNIKNNRIFSVILCMKHIIGLTDEWLLFVDSLERLLQDFPMAEKNNIGFPQDWRSLITTMQSSVH